MDQLTLITSADHGTNRILLCYNPILTICLACEDLSKISDAVNIFDLECAKLSDSLLDLGSKIADSIDDDKVLHIQYNPGNLDTKDLPGF